MSDYITIPSLGDIEITTYFKSEGKAYSPKKERLIKYQIRQMLKRTLQMFKWSNLPERITQRELELMLQTRGHIGIINYEGEFYSVIGGLGGEPNWNYMPTTYVVANPFLKLSKTFNIYDINDKKKDVVVIPNDSLYEGTLEILSFHSEILTEIQLTKRMVMIVHRMPQVPVAPDNNAYEDVKSYYNSLEEGEISSIQVKNIFKDMSTIPLSDSGRNIITQVLEMEQYQKAAMYNDIGIQLNYNMKRETITSSEAQLGEGALLPLCDDMLECRKKAAEEVNKLFGLNISVEYSSSWKNLKDSITNEIKKEEAEVENLKAEEVQSTEQENVEKDNEQQEDTNENTSS